MQKFSFGIKSAVIALLLLSAGCTNDDPLKKVASAKQFLERKDLNSAKIEIKSALDINPGYGEARFLLGTVLLKEGNPSNAEVEFRKARAAKYPEYLVVPELAQAMLQLGQAAKLADEFGKMRFEQVAAHARLQTILALAHGALDKPELADSALRAALAADPSYSPALIVSARQKAAARDFDGAFQILAEINSREPENANAWKLKGDLLLYGKNRVDDALAAYRKSIEVGVDFAPGHIALLTLLLQLDQLDDGAKQVQVLKKFAPNHPQTKYFEAELAYRKKDYLLARELSRQLLNVARDNPRALVLAGAIELQLDALAQAETYFTKAILAAPQFTIARRLLIATYLRSGQPAKALAALTADAGKNGIDPSQFWIAGEVYLHNGDARKAEEYFVKATKHEPDNLLARTALAVTRLSGGQADAAFEALQNIAEADKGVMADLALISAHLRRKEFDKALAAIDKLAAKQPDKPLAAMLRGQVQVALKDGAGARKSFERALAINPSYFAAAAGLAALDLADTKPEDAKSRFETLLTKNPKNEQAWIALAKIAAANGAGTDKVAGLLSKAVDANPLEITSRLLLIELFLGSNDNKQALAAAQNGVATLPNSVEMLSALGRVQQISGDPNQALVTYAKLIPLQPLAPYPHIRIAEAHVAGKNKSAAEQSLRKALELDPRSLDAQSAMIALVIEASRYQEATKIARTMQQQRPKSSGGFLLEGDIAAKQQDWDAAARAYQSGLQQAPSTLLATKLHAILVLAAKGPEAYRFAATWTKDHPKDGAFLSHLGDMALARRDFVLAERNYLAVLQVQPDNAGALNNLAWVTGQLGKQGAIAYAERAHKLVPNQPAYLDTLAMLLAEQNEFAKAIELGKRVGALQPSNPVWQLNLAKIYVMSGDKAKAKIELDALAKMGEKFAGQVEVAALLRTL